METFLFIFFSLSLLALFLAFFLTKRRKKDPVQPIPQSYRKILQDDVPFYEKLEPTKKIEFEQRLMHFLATTRITGIKTTVEEIDTVYIAASAIIPIFGFPKWEYANLHEILLYPQSFNHEFEQTGEERNILGVVGEGAYSNIMILSQQELREAFENKTGKENTAIHEFVHLIDKSDGYVDGVPELFVNRQYVLPWINHIEKEIDHILENRSEINPYGATNRAEFFAVVSEYFFERPELLEEKHPELYKLLVQVFKQQPRK